MKTSHHSILLLLFAAGTFSACTTPATTVSSSSEPAYQSGSDHLQPELRLFHFSDDSSLVHVRVHTADLLYARMNPDEAFSSKLKISLQVYEQGELVDSSSLLLTDANSDGFSKYLNAELKFALRDSAQGEVLVRLSDVLREEEKTRVLDFDKSNRINEHNFFFSYRGGNEAITGSAVKESSLIDVRFRSGQQQAFTLHQFNVQRPLPPPPFSYQNPESLTQLKADRSQELLPEEGKLSFFAERGLYLLTVKGEAEGRCVEVRATDFPRVSTTGELVKSLRYITSRNEYEALATSGEMKLRLDEFWLECGGKPDRARELIRIYYSRVEDANRYFSSHEEGWRTDRGLVHVIYGRPNKVQRKTDHETWIYGEENNLNALSFTFRRMDNPFSTNHYVLLRDPIYKTSWTRAVDSWRNGRIYNE